MLLQSDHNCRPPICSLWKNSKTQVSRLITFLFLARLPPDRMRMSYVCSCNPSPEIVGSQQYSTGWVSYLMSKEKG